jgi:hypothetical protein
MLDLLKIACEALAEHVATGLELAQSGDACTKRRKSKALSLLADHPNWRRVIVVEAGDPAILSVAIRGVGYCEIEISADYNPALLLALLAQHGQLTTDP